MNFVHCYCLIRRAGAALADTQCSGFNGLHINGVLLSNREVCKELVALLYPYGADVVFIIDTVVGLLPPADIPDILDGDYGAHTVFIEQFDLYARGRASGQIIITATGR